MALIKCPECGKEVSDKAERCINCGYPINNIKKENALNNTKETISSATETVKIKVGETINDFKNNYTNSSETTVIKKAKDSWTNSQKGSKKAIGLLIGIVIVAIVLVLILAPNKYQKIAIRDCKTLQSMCKSPSSFKAYDVYVYHEDDYGDVSVIKYEAANSYGGSVMSTCIFSNGHYMGDYDDDVSDFESQNAYDHFLMAGLRYTLWQAQGGGDDGLKFHEIHHIDGDYINSKL